MFPILFTIGNLQVSSFSIFLILSWSVFSFVFWKSLRDEGIGEEISFDLAFYGTITALCAARAWYVLTHWTQFSSSYIKIIALWVAPGLSLLAGIGAGLAVILALAKKRKIRMGTIVDAVGMALPGALLVASVGAFLDGGVVGRVAGIAWAVRYVGAGEALRHPVQLYMALVLSIILAVVGFASGLAVRKKWPTGTVGLLFFFLWFGAVFALEFLVDNVVYWYGASANQWEALLLFFAAVGAWYGYAGGKYVVRQYTESMKVRISRIMHNVYAKFSNKCS